MSGFAQNTVHRLLACWGNGDYGRLGHGVQCLPELIPRVCSALTDAPVASVVCGGAHTVSLTDTGSAFTMGLNESGQLGHSANAQFVPVPQEVQMPDPVEQIAAGHHHTLFLTRSGDVWACGRNSRGQLGLGGKFGSFAATPHRVEALVGTGIVSIAAGAEHSMAMSKEGQLFSWGYGTNGRLGHSPTSKRLWHRTRDEYTPRLVQGIPQKVLHAACGHMHSGCAYPLLVALDLNNHSRHATQFKTFVTTTQSLLPQVDTKMCLDAVSGCVDADGNAYTWGYGAFWQLGTGSNADQGQPHQVPAVHNVAQLAMGGAHTLALGQAGGLSAWGSNHHGALGLGIGSSNDAHEPARLPQLSCTQVSAGWKHSAAVGDNGQLYAWGWGGSVGTTTNLESGHSSGGQLGLDNEFDCWGPTQISDLQTGTKLKGVQPVWNAVQVSCGFNHTAAVIEVDISGDLLDRRT